MLYHWQHYAAGGHAIPFVQTRIRQTAVAAVFLAACPLLCMQTGLAGVAIDSSRELPDTLMAMQEDVLPRSVQEASQRGNVLRMDPTPR